MAWVSNYISLFYLDIIIVLLFLMFIYCLLYSKYNIKKMNANTYAKKKKKEMIQIYHYAGDLETWNTYDHWRNSQSLLGSKTGNIGDDLYNFIFGEAGKIIVHELLDCWSPGGCLEVTKRTVTLKMFVTTVSFRPKKLGMIHICSVHPLICRNNNILLLKTWRMALYILAILRHYCSTIGGAPAR